MMRIRKHLLNFTKHDLLNTKEEHIVGELNYNNNLKNTNTFLSWNAFLIMCISPSFPSHVLVKHHQLWSKCSSHSKFSTCQVPSPIFPDVYLRFSFHKVRTSRGQSGLGITRYPTMHFI